VNERKDRSSATPLTPMHVLTASPVVSPTAFLSFDDGGLFLSLPCLVLGGACYLETVAFAALAVSADTPGPKIKKRERCVWMGGGGLARRLSLNHCLAFSFLIWAACGIMDL
jgi:hypothetical protein